MERRHMMLELVVALLLVIGAAMLYLETWRSGELEHLSRRVDELEHARRKRAARQPATPEAKP
jgi:hypothetical protein